MCIGDFGCGEARLAAELMRNPGRDKVLVHSFDLVAANTLITACDIAHVCIKCPPQRFSPSSYGWHFIFMLLCFCLCLLLWFCDTFIYAFVRSIYALIIEFA